MKNILFVIFILLSYTQFNQAQTPNSFSYQAVVRDASGMTTNNQAVSFRISILQTTPTGTSVYSEAHSATTNDFGLVNLEIGGGSLLSGNISTIDWGNDDYFVKVDLDATGGTNYTTMGTTQLLSVPFAMYAKNSGDKVWDKSGNNAVYNSGNIGIGTSAPSTKLELTQTAVNGPVEKLIKLNISDAPNDNLIIRNSTQINGRFVPDIEGTVESSIFQALTIAGATNAASDVGTMPLMIFQAKRQGAALTTRPLFQWRNYITSHMTMTANGNLGLGTTTPARKLHVTEAMRLQPSATAPSNPSAGDMYFSSANNKLMVYDGTTWQACW